MRDAQPARDGCCMSTLSSPDLLDEFDVECSRCGGTHVAQVFKVGPAARPYAEAVVACGTFRTRFFTISLDTGSLTASKEMLESLLAPARS